MTFSVNNNDGSVDRSPDGSGLRRRVLIGVVWFIEVGIKEINVFQVTSFPNASVGNRDAKNTNRYTYEK